MIQVDYSASYHNKNQDEIQSTYFGHRPSVFLQHAAISVQVKELISKKFQ